MKFERDFDDQNGVLGRQRDQQYQADLGIEVVLDPQSRQHGHRTEQRQRDRQDHRDRRVPAFILPGQHQIDQQKRQTEHIVDLVADRLLLVRHRRPIEAAARRQGPGGDLVHQRHRLTGAVALRRQADNRRRRIEIVQADQRRTH